MKSKSQNCEKESLTKREAQTRLNFLRRHRNKKYRKEARIYHCPNCNGYHLTSRE